MGRFEDVIVAGGGLAGVCTAAALSTLGYGVVLVEPGLVRARRLAGELLHSPALRDLSDLGLAEVIVDTKALPVYGFALFAGCDGKDRCVLPYETAQGPGAAVEHSSLIEALLARARQLTGVTVLTGARVIGVTQNRDYVVVSLDAGTSRQTVLTRMLIAADGRGSSVRRLAGIDATRTTLSTMSGLLVETDSLPYPHFGHVFVGGASLALAYQIAPGRTRVMLDINRDIQDFARAIRDDQLLASLPDPLRSEVRQVVHKQRPLAAANVTMWPDAIAKGRVALVGDAAGCCHPVSASGLASAAHDARTLQWALRQIPSNVPRALKLYAQLRRGPQRTRLALATALYRVFTEPTREMALLRWGLFRYWHLSATGRAASMALLSTAEMRSGASAREYARVVGYALPGLFGSPDALTAPPARTFARLLSSTLPYAGQAVREVLESLKPHTDA